MDVRYDTAVIGAGLAGLRTADLLRRAGRTTVVLEAADRVGGRLLRQTVAGVAVDGGGAWVGPRQRRVQALIAELGLSTTPTHTSGRNLFWLNGRMRSSPSWLPPIPPLAMADAGQAMLRLDAIARRLPRRSAALDRMTVGDWLVRHVHTHGARTLLEIGVGATTGSSVDEISLLAFAHHIRTAGGLNQLTGVRGAAQDARIDGGAVGLCERLAARIGTIRTTSTVVAVQQGAERAVVHVADGARVEADRVVVAVDPATCARIDFGPTLPAGRRTLHREYRMGSGIKYHIAYRTAFWRAAGLSGQAYSDTGLARLTFDATPDPTGPGILVGFLGDLAGEGLPSSPAERRQRVIDALRRFFGDRAADPLDYVEQDWRVEPTLTGCVPAPGPGVLTAAGPDTKSPAGRVHWAGAESASDWEGHMEGALDSAERASAEILRAG